MIYLDCSFIYREPSAHTGIQRVTRCVAREAVKLADDIKWSMMDWDGNFFMLDDIPDKTSLPRNIKKSPLHFKPNDIYFILDSGWDMMMLKFLLPYKAMGVKVGAMYHDLIPITHSQFSGISTDHFVSWVVDTYKYCDFFACNSNSTRETLISYAGKLWPYRDMEDDMFFTFPLGADLPNVANDYEPQNDILKKAMEGERTFIAVSTLEPRKNQGLLIDAFDQLWESNSELKLCLIGAKGWMVENLAARIESHPQKNKKLFWLKDITDKELQWVYSKAYCTLFASFTEGFGLALIESLHYGTPVLASDIPIFHEIGGDSIGYFDPFDAGSLVKWLQQLDKDGIPSNFKNINFKWPTWKDGTEVLISKIRNISGENIERQTFNNVDKFFSSISSVNKKNNECAEKVKKDRNDRCIKENETFVKKNYRFIQGLRSFCQHDAIGNNVRAIDKTMNMDGYITHITAVDGNACSEVVIPFDALNEFMNGSRDIFIFHMGIGSYENNIISSLSAYKKIMIYHNITPSFYISLDDPKLAELCHQGTIQLKEMKDDYDFAIADSNFNAEDLKSLGYKKVVTIPLIVDFEHFENAVSSPKLKKRLSDGKKNIIFVGRIVANKCQHDVIAAFWEYKKLHPESRLLLVGSDIERYRTRLKKIINDYGLTDCVEMPGSINIEELKAVYETADLFLSMSEHEGFCVPLLESMYFGIPILAFAAGAVPETLGQCGVLFTDKNYKEIAKMMLTMTTDGELINNIVESQRQRLNDYAPQKVYDKLIDCLYKNIPFELHDIPAEEFVKKPTFLPRSYPTKELLQQHGRELIINSYVRFLHRVPHAPEISFYMKKLRQGLPTISLIAGIRFSEEGRKVAEPVRHAKLLEFTGRLLANEGILGKIARSLYLVKKLPQTVIVANRHSIDLQEQDYLIKNLQTRNKELRTDFLNQSEKAEVLEILMKEQHDVVQKSIQKTHLLERKLDAANDLLELETDHINVVEDRLNGMNNKLNDGLNVVNDRLSEACKEVSDIRNVAVETETNLRPPTLSFAKYADTNNFLDNAIKRIGENPPKDPKQKSEAFYSYFSEIWDDNYESIQKKHYESYAQYLPSNSHNSFLDFGCGAGEFMSFLQSRGINPLGVDYDEKEIERCRARGLNVHLDDGLNFLKKYNGQLSGVSMLQVIEHIELDRHVELLSTVIDRLEDGGVVIIETINPAHPLALNNFFTDPTHVRPVPSDYLAFVAQWCGFCKTGILSLCPTPVLQSAINEPKFHYSNYAIIAYKPFPNAQQ